MAAPRPSERPQGAHGPVDTAGAGSGGPAPAADDTARRERIEVLAVPRELLIAASGRPITVSTPDGTEVILRIPTAEEFREANRRGREMVAGLGIDPPPPASDALIADIIKPLPIWGAE